VGLALGTITGGYRIEGILGRGGMGIVYAARQLSLDRPVALKLLSPALSDDEEFRERFRREGRIQAAIDHPHIVTIHEAGELEDGLFLAMRLIHGPSLKELVTLEDVAPDRALRLLAPIADALDSAHAVGLVHRDVKPQNILVGARDHPFLADFGLTKSADSVGLTKTGQFVGTMDYISPEQIRGELASPASDTYSLAAVLVQCLTGAVPFPRDTDAAALYAHLIEPPPRVTERRRELPPALDEVVAAGMAKDPADRPATATELIEAARRALEASRSLALPPAGAEWPAGADGAEETRERFPQPPAVAGERAPGTSTIAPAAPVPAGLSPSASAPSAPAPVSHPSGTLAPSVPVSHPSAASAPSLPVSHPSAPSVPADSTPGAPADSMPSAPAPVTAPAHAQAPAEAPSRPATPDDLGISPSPSWPAPAGPATPPPPTFPPAQPRDRRRSRTRQRVLAAVGLVAAVLVGVLLALPGDDEPAGGAPADPTVTAEALSGSASNADVALRFPSDWRPSGNVGDIPGMTFADGLALESVDGTRVLLAGQTEGEGPTLLPAAFRAELDGPVGAGEPVSLGDVEALRHRDLRVTGFPSPITAYSVPTSRGVLSVACYGTAAVEAECASVAATLEPLRSEARSLGPDAEYARGLDATMKRLNGQHLRERDRLRRARTARGQARIAAAAGSAFTAAQRRVAGLSPGPAETPVNRRIAAALVDGAQAYQGLASAARRRDRADFDRAKRAVTRAEDDVREGLAALEPLGYQIR
jgi:serine/threonine protein kinase